MAFRVGQKVVCVDDAPPVGGNGRPSPLALNKIYTISAIGEPFFDGTTQLVLVEQHGRDVHGRLHKDYGFRASRFRPLIERKTSTGFEILDEIRKRESVDETTRAPRRATV